MHWIKRNGISRTQPIVCIYSHIFRYEIALAWKFNELKQIALLLCAVLLNDDGRCGWIIKKPSHTCIQTIQVEYSFFFLYLRGFIVLVLFLWFNENVSVFFVALFALKKRQRLHTKKMREKCIQSIKTDYKQQIFDFSNYIEIHMPWRMWDFFSQENAHMKYLASARFECNRQNVHAFCVIWIINSARIQSNHIPNKSKFDWIDRPVMRQSKNSERNERTIDLTTSKEYRKEMQFFGGATNAAFVFYWIFDMYFSETWFTI